MKKKLLEEAIFQGFRDFGSFSTPKKLGVKAIFWGDVFSVGTDEPIQSEKSRGVRFWRRNLIKHQRVWQMEPRPTRFGVIW
jgi:hypothetical protein